MLDGQGLGEAQDQLSAQVGARSLLLVATEYYVVIVEPWMYQSMFGTMSGH